MPGAGRRIAAGMLLIFVVLTVIFLVSKSMPVPTYSKLEVYLAHFVFLLFLLLLLYSPLAVLVLLVVVSSNR
jgi:hypothetical protein